MLPQNAVTEKMIRATNARTFAGRGFTLFLELNKSAEELGIRSHNYFICDTADTVKQYDLMKKVSTNHVQATVCLSNAYPDCSPEGTCIMYFTTMFMSDDWGSVSDEDYFKMKNQIAEDMINVFERETGCRIRDSIEEIAVASPTTYARYCGHPQGVIYGYETCDWDSLMPRMMMMKEDAGLFPGLRFVGGSGITPFVSMAKSMIEGSEDFSMTLFYGATDEQHLAYKDQLDEFSRHGLKVIYVLSDEEKEDYEYGFITKELIAKYADIESSTFFMCGPVKMYEFVTEQLSGCNLPLKAVHKDAACCPDLPAADPDTYTLTVHMRDQVYTIPALENETIPHSYGTGRIKRAKQMPGRRMRILPQKQSQNF